MIGDCLETGRDVLYLPLPPTLALAFSLLRVLPVVYPPISYQCDFLAVGSFLDRLFANGGPARVLSEVPLWMDAFILY